MVGPGGLHVADHIFKLGLEGVMEGVHNPGAVVLILVLQNKILGKVHLLCEHLLADGCFLLAGFLPGIRVVGEYVDMKPLGT